MFERLSAGTDVTAMFERLSAGTDVTAMFERLSAGTDVTAMFDRLSAGTDVTAMFDRLSAEMDISELVDRLSASRDLDHLWESIEWPDVESAFDVANRVLREAEGRELAEHERESVLTALLAAAALRRIAAIVVLVAVAHVSGATSVAVVLLAIVHGLLAKYPAVAGLLELWGIAEVLKRLVLWIKSEAGGDAGKP